MSMVIGFEYQPTCLYVLSCVVVVAGSVGYAGSDSVGSGSVGFSGGGGSV